MPFILADIVSVKQQRGEGQVLNQQAFFLVAVDAVPRDVDFYVVGRVVVALDFNSAVVIHSKVVLLDVNYSTDVLVDRVRKPANIDARVDLRSNQVRLNHAEVARIDEHERTRDRLGQIALVDLDCCVAASSNLVIEASHDARCDQKASLVWLLLDSNLRVDPAVLVDIHAELVQTRRVLIHRFCVHPKANFVHVVLQNLLLFLLVGEVATKDFA